MSLGKSRLTLLLSTLGLLILVSGCSTNGQESKSSSAEPSIAINVKERTTTTLTGTENSIDEEIEQKVSASLSKALIGGTKNTDVFDESVIDLASTDFLDNSKAKDNKVILSLHLLVNAEQSPDLVVAEIEHQVKTGEVVTKKSGKIFLNPDGKIIGFDFPSNPEGSQV